MRAHQVVISNRNKSTYTRCTGSRHTKSFDALAFSIRHRSDFTSHFSFIAGNANDDDDGKTTIHNALQHTRSFMQSSTLGAICPCMCRFHDRVNVSTHFKLCMCFAANNFLCSIHSAKKLFVHFAMGAEYLSIFFFSRNVSN